MNAKTLSLSAALLLMGLSAGFFFTYEASVTLGLAEVDDITYVKTFQAINATIRNVWFGIVFFGSLPATALALYAHRKDSIIVRTLFGFGLVLYIACVAITMGGNVPLNDELATVTDITAESASQARADFEADWNTLNLLRTIAVVGGFGSLIAAAAVRSHSAHVTGSRSVNR